MFTATGYYDAYTIICNRTQGLWRSYHRRYDPAGVELSELIMYGDSCMDDYVLTGVAKYDFMEYIRSERRTIIPIFIVRRQNFEQASTRVYLSKLAILEAFIDCDCDVDILMKYIDPWVRIAVGYDVDPGKQHSPGVYHCIELGSGDDLGTVPSRAKSLDERQLYIRKYFDAPRSVEAMAAVDMTVEDIIAAESVRYGL